MLNGADKIYREIESLTRNSSASLRSTFEIGNSTQNTDGLVVYKKKRRLDSNGNILDNNDIILDTIKLDSWSLIKLSDFFQVWKESNYSKEVFDRLIILDNNSASKLEIDGKSIYVPTTISLVKYSKALFANITNLARYDIETNISDMSTEDGDLLFDNDLYTLRDTVIQHSFIRDDKHSEYTRNFNDNRGSVAFWLLLIRNHISPELLSGAVPNIVELREINNSVDSSTSDYTSSIHYRNKSERYLMEILGYHGDNSSHYFSGKSWKILSDNISFGDKSHSYGNTSISLGDGIASGVASFASNSTVSNYMNSSSFGIGTIAGIDEHSFISITGGYIGGRLYKISVSSLLSTYSTDDGKNGVLLYAMINNQGSYYNKTITATIESIELSPTTNSTVLTLRLPDTYFNRIVSGNICRLPSSDNSIFSKFAIGQYNNPNSKSIFQIGTGTSDKSRDTFVEVGIDSGTKYFRIGLDSTSGNISGDKYKDYFKSTRDYIYMSTGTNHILINPDTLEVKHGNISKIEFTSNSMKSIMSNSQNGLYSYPTNTSILYGDSKMFFGNTGDISITVDGDIEITSGSYINLRGNELNILSLFNDQITIGEKSTTLETSIATRNTCFINTNTSRINVQQYSINVNQRVEFAGDGEFRFMGGILSLNSLLNITRAQSDDMYKLWSKNPNTGGNHNITSTAGETGFENLKYAGFYRLIDTHGIGVPDSQYAAQNGIHVLSNRHNINNHWVLASDSNYGNLNTSEDTDSHGIWTSEYNYPQSGGYSQWKRFAYHDEVSPMGMVVDYKYVGAFAEFNVNSSDTQQVRSGKLSNFCVITQSQIASDLTIYTNTASQQSTNIRFISMDYSQNSPFVNIQGTNSSSQQGSFLTGVKLPSQSLSGYLEGGSVFIESALFSKIGNTVYFDITIRFGELDNNITSTSDANSQFGILFVTGKNNQELLPAHSVKFQQQNKSMLDYRYGLKVSPFRDGQGTAFVITRQDLDKIKINNEATNTSDNAAGQAGSLRAYFSGQYKSMNAQSIPYINTNIT